MSEDDTRAHQRTVMLAMSNDELIDLLFEANDEIDRLTNRAGMLLARLRSIENICEGVK